MKPAAHLSYALNNAALRNRATYIRLRVENDAAIAAEKAKFATFAAVTRADRDVFFLEVLWIQSAMFRRFAQDLALGRRP